MCANTNTNTNTNSNTNKTRHLLEAALQVKTSPRSIQTVRNLLFEVIAHTFTSPLTLRSSTSQCQHEHAHKKHLTGNHLVPDNKSKCSCVSVLWETLPHGQHLRNRLLAINTNDAHLDLGEETERKNNAVELADPEYVDCQETSSSPSPSPSPPECVDRQRGGDQGPGEQGGVHTSFQGAGSKMIRIEPFE